MANAIVSGGTPVCSVLKKMDAEYNKAQRGYINMAGLVMVCKRDRLYESAGYKNIYDCCKDRYGMSRGTVGNLVCIGEQFCDDSGKLLPEHDGKGMNELIAELPNRNVKKLQSTESDRQELLVLVEEAMQEDVDYEVKRASIKGKRLTVTLTINLPDND